jgi:uncharacterized protein YjiS (DUF1127 family)
MTGTPPGGGRDRLIDWWRRRQQVAREQRLAIQISDRDLRDLGLTRGDLHRELHNSRRLLAVIP